MKKSSMAICALCLLATTAWFWPQSGERAPAEHQYSANLEILDQIPLYPNWESPRKDENKIAEALTRIFSKIADEGANRDGTLNRGTHAQGICFEGETSIFDEHELSSRFGQTREVTKKILQGLFSSPDSYATRIRFANAKGQRLPDTAPDVRAISFSIDTEGRLETPDLSGKLDFMMNSSPMFAVNNIKEFYELMKAARLAQGDIRYFLNPLYIPAVLKAKKLLDEYERNDIKSYATESYWGNLPYVHGVNAAGEPTQVVKYKLRPCSGPERVSESSLGKGPFYLQEDISSRSLEEGVCFHLQVQVFNRAKLRNSLNGERKGWSQVDWIENGGELWEESVLPFHTVAQVSIPKGTAPVSCDDFAFNTRLRSSIEHRPIGSIARVRTYVEESSRTRRQGR